MYSTWYVEYRCTHTRTHIWIERERGREKPEHTHTQQIVWYMCLYILSESTSNSFSIWKFHHLNRLYVHFIHSYLEWIARSCSRQPLIANRTLFALYLSLLLLLLLNFQWFCRHHHRHPHQYQYHAWWSSSSLSSSIVWWASELIFVYFVFFSLHVSLDRVYRSEQPYDYFWITNLMFSICWTIISLYALSFNEFTYNFSIFCFNFFVVHQLENRFKLVNSTFAICWVKKSWWWKLSSVRKEMRSIHPTVVCACVRMSEATVYRRVLCFFSTILIIHFRKSIFNESEITLRNKRRKKLTHTHTKRKFILKQNRSYAHALLYYALCDAFASKQMVTWKAETNEKSNERTNDRKKPIGSELEYSSSERVHRKGADHAM